MLVCFFTASCWSLVQAVLLSSSFVRDAFRGILRARVLSAEGLRGAGMAGAVAVGVPI